MRTLALCAVGLSLGLLGLASDGGPDSVDNIGAYKTWAKANPEPVSMSAQVAVMCRMPTPKEQTAMAPNSPHRDYMLTVFVNDVAKDAFFTKAKPQMPVGSVIVKEKLAGKDAKEPELLTAMVKREKGYDPAHGDWEYVVLNGKAERVIGRGKIDSCQSCHDSQKAEGYLYRDYLPWDVASKLK